MYEKKALMVSKSPAISTHTHAITAHTYTHAITAHTHAHAPLA